MYSGFVRSMPCCNVDAVRRPASNVHVVLMPRYRIWSFLPLPVRLTAAPPSTGTFQMSQPSDSSTALLSFVHPNALFDGGTRLLWSSSTSANDVCVTDFV